MANLTLVRRDSYLDHLKSDIKQDTLAALRDAALQLATLFLHSVLKKAVDDKYKNKGLLWLFISQEGMFSLFTLMKNPASHLTSHNSSWSGQPAWKSISGKASI